MICIVACLEIDAATPEEAYAKLHAVMPKLSGDGVSWASTDEWYDADGEPLDTETISAARAAVSAKGLLG